MIEVSLRKHGISDRTIRRALPDELKNINMIREPRPRALEDKIPDRVEQIQTNDDSKPIPEPRTYKPNLSTDGKIQSWDNTKMIEQRQEGKLRSHSLVLV